MATLTTKFSLGDQVWRIKSAWEDIKLPCRSCRGRGWLEAEAADGRRQVKCPECGVNATVTLGTWPEWKVEPDPLTIGKIQVEVYDHSRTEDNGELGHNRNPSLMSNEDEESYMAWSTGVGSGSIHHVEDLFATPEEAAEEAERRTQRARAGEEPTGQRGWRRWWPSNEQVRIAAGFLDHRDIYEHDAAHVALAEAIVEVGKKRDAAR